MKGLIVGLGAAVVLLAARGQTDLVAQGGVPAPPDTRTTFFASAMGHRITIMRNGSLLTRLEIPRGVLLSISADLPPSSSLSLSRLEYQGSVVIRTKPDTEVDRFGSASGSAIMATAPMVLIVDGSNVVVDEVRP